VILAPGLGGVAFLPWAGAVDLAAYYPFDDSPAEGGGRHSEATLVEDTAWSLEKPAGLKHSKGSLEVQPNGRRGGVTLPRSVSPALLEGAPYSISLWARSHGFFSDKEKPGSRVLLAKRNVGREWPGTDFMLQVHHSDGNHFELIGEKLKGNVEVDDSVDPGLALSENTWHHVVMTTDGIGKWTFYIDNSAGLEGRTMPPDTGDALQIGWDAVNPDPNWNWDGEIDDVAIYRGELDAGEVAALFLGTHPAELAGAAKAEQDREFTAEQVAYFEANVRPLLARRCYKCHSARAEKLKAGLRLDGRAFVLKGGDTGSAIVPGYPEKSLLVKAVRYLSIEMPPKGRLPDEEVAILARWIEIGAPWPKEEPVAVNRSDPENYDWNKLRDGHWAYRPVNRPAVPEVSDPAWTRNEIDRFILARLETAGLKPSPPADLRFLVRRIYYDLLGLPPSPEETAAFLEAAAQDRSVAVKELVDRLLASPHYGERWGRHWLDVARYADLDKGRYEPPGAWRYRDWVIAAFNRDLPYDQFVKLQIAGDLIAGKEDAVATGLFALGTVYRTDGGDPDGIAKSKAATLDDRMDTLSRGFLALTVSCARCHDHKFDPIPTLDYYSLAGIFNNTHMGAEHDGDIIGAQSKAEMHVLAERGGGDMPVALRGNLRKPGPVAPRRFLRILAGADAPRFTEGSGRLELAEAVASAENPLTARVIVNRIWLHHFGRALVRTPSNFGLKGEQPTHPELLDWLAAEFVASGWSFKKLHRTIMNSAAYQMGSRREETAFRTDGDNRLLWRMNPRRLDAESWRDTLLAVTGELDRTLGGKAIEDLHSKRRTVYLKVSRSGDQFATDEYLRAFDFPLMQASVPKRPVSVVPQQFLFLLNSRFITDRAGALAGRLEKDASDDEARIERAYRLLHGRTASDLEKQLGLEFLAQASGDPETKLTPWQQLAQVLLSSNELMNVR